VSCERRQLSGTTSHSLGVSREIAGRSIDPSSSSHLGIVGERMSSLGSNPLGTELFFKITYKLCSYCIACKCIDLLDYDGLLINIDKDK
jgi:hypothetical protein